MMLLVWLLVWLLVRWTAGLLPLPGTAIEADELLQLVQLLVGKQAVGECNTAQTGPLPRLLKDLREALVQDSKG